MFNAQLEPSKLSEAVTTINVCLSSVKSKIFHLYGDMEISLSPGQGCRIQPFAQHTRPLSREGPLSCHTCYDTQILLSVQWFKLIKVTNDLNLFNILFYVIPLFSDIIKYSLNIYKIFARNIFFSKNEQGVRFPLCFPQKNFSYNIYKYVHIFRTSA